MAGPVNRSIDCEVAVIGAGIAGASAAAFLAPHARVLILEAESQPGYHTTGRSAAFLAESYGAPLVRPLTRASKRFYLEPPPGFAEAPLASPRGALYVFDEAARAQAEADAAEFARDIAGVRILDAAEARAMVPVLRAERLAGAVLDPECRDLDVAAIHHGFLRRAKAGGAELVTDARVDSLARDDGHWRLRLADGREIRAGRVVNAAGAWVDEVAKAAGLAPLGFRPLRRTIIIFTPRTVAVDPRWPVVIEIHEDFYFKPETGRILASPADETPSPPCDAQPEDIDVAIAVDRIQRWTTLDVPRITNKWAGLRTFAPDRVPVVGEDPRAPGFFWCAGQGGYGIQTAWAMGRLTAAVVLGEELPPALREAGVRAENYAPDRFLVAA
ncbi:MAG: FAD-dependent catabolic D-arginine dehydrogenase DauA [Rhodothalassiaceae bacterium]|nr:MAG: FAD-dependent catabolic D-arginine dehydrogenase DauA [Rhodothalassiaceae bacterium]